MTEQVISIVDTFLTYLNEHRGGEMYNFDWKSPDGVQAIQIMHKYELIQPIAQPGKLVYISPNGEAVIKSRGIRYYLNNIKLKAEKIEILTTEKLRNDVNYSTDSIKISKKNLKATIITAIILTITALIIWLKAK